MGCEACDEFQDETNRSYYYRWGAANIEVRACADHVKEVFDVLNAEQARRRLESQLPKPTTEKPGT